MCVCGFFFCLVFPPVAYTEFAASEALTKVTTA